MVDDVVVVVVVFAVGVTKVVGVVKLDVGLVKEGSMEVGSATVAFVAVAVVALVVVAFVVVVVVVVLVLVPLVVAMVGWDGAPPLKPPNKKIKPTIKPSKTKIPSKIHNHGGHPPFLVFFLFSMTGAGTGAVYT